MDVYPWGGRLLMLTLLSVLGWGCQLSIPDPGTPIQTERTMESLQVPNDFLFETSGQKEIRVSIYDGANAPIPGVKVEAYTAPSTVEGKRMASMISDATGQVSFNLKISDAAEYVYLHSTYIGLIDWMKVPVENPAISVSWGEDAYTYDTSQDSLADYAARKTENVPFYYFGSYDSQGKPDYLTARRDNVTQDLLSLVNSSLPEGYPVPTYNPQYIADTTITDLRLKDSAEVFITFVHEGAGYRNAVGYYAYDLQNPPETVDDIDSLKLIFPNTSLAGSGGSLRAGDKVRLGNFPPNTGIGLFLVPNGWNGSVVAQQSGYDKHLKFSNKAFNTFATDESNKGHIALLNDPNRELILIGFEDISRPGGDKDFNDAVFYFTASPYDAIITDNLAETKVTGNDRDGDNVTDPNDEFPDDGDLAFRQYSPAENEFGTLAFEDFWPSKGDYDFNDLVIDYNYEYQTNTANRVRKIVATFVLKAMGAGLNNGFGVEFNMPPSYVDSVSGSRLTAGKITIQANGLEANQAKAAIVAFDNWRSIMRPSNGQFVNTEPEATYITPDTLRITISLNTAVPLNDLLARGTNPFMISGKGRGYEIHLAGFPPTSLATQSLFGTEDDATDLSTKFYQTAKGLPWAVEVPTPFSYPSERETIIAAHAKFADWVESGGGSFTDWYDNKTGYRVTSKIFPHIR